MGRPTKRTPETLERLIKAIESGANYSLACHYARISYELFRLWARDDPDFLVAVREAEGRAALGWLEQIDHAADNGNWQAAAWQLERRYPQWYGRRAVDVRNIDLSGLSDEELRALAGVSEE
jgi:hypothetical protein